MSPLSGPIGGSENCGGGKIVELNVASHEAMLIEYIVKVSRPNGPEEPIGFAASIGADTPEKQRAIDGLIAAFGAFTDAFGGSRSGG